MAKRLVTPSIDIEAVIAHAFRATTADSFMGLRLGMTGSDVERVIGSKGTWQKANRTFFWERPGPCGLTEQIGAIFRPGSSAKSPGELIGAELLLSSREASAAKPFRDLVKAVRAELGRRFKPIEDKSTFRFVVDGRVNRLWVGGGATTDAAGGGPLAHTKITLSDPTY